MVDGFKTSSLALDVHQLANKLGVDISPKAVYINIEGLIFGFTDRVDVTTGEIRKLCNLHGSLHKYANGGLHNADSLTCAVYLLNCKKSTGLIPILRGFIASNLA